ncbi:MAG: hypothetical protein PHN45_08650, partial [Methylococcales bacterium]|nr:hypothetical protein [Methylococcales bacterium]
TWAFMPKVLPIGTYNVAATGDAAHGILVDTSTGELIVTATQVPTVTPMSPTTNTTPTITGTVGNTPLSILPAEAFSVKVNNVIYTNGDGKLSVSSTAWTLKIPTALAIGIYDVDAVRGTGASAVADPTSKELEIIGTNPTVTNINQITNDTTPTILGTFGGTDLGANEAFSVTVNGIIYQLGDGNLTKGGSSTWSLTIPAANALRSGDYEVDAVRNNTLHDLSSNELHIVLAVPTVISQSLREKLPIVIKGTVGDVALDNTETFTVSVNNKTYTYKTDAALAITTMTWTLTIPTTEVFPAATYEVLATRDGTLNDTSTGELIVIALKPPTVISQTTFDTTPVIKGTAGDVILETTEAFTVAVNNKTYTKGIDSNLVVSGMNWTLTILTGSEIPSRVQPYDVIASRDTLADITTSELTIQVCALPKVVNAAGDACIDPIPTVISQTLTTNSAIAPVIKGTVGEVALGSTEVFSVTIKTTPSQIYTYKTDSALVISGMNWTLTVPIAKAISAGTYDVDAARNTTATDITSKELIINLVCLATETVMNGACVASSSLPTVDILSTDDTTPVVTGKVGDVILGDTEDFTVEVNTIVYPKSQLTISGLTWSLQIPLSNALTPTTYDVVALRNGTITDATTGELTITACTSPKTINTNTGDCSTPSLIPTVTPSASHGLHDPQIVVAGTVGDIPLTAQELTDNAFTVTITEHGKSSNSLTGALVVTGTNWTFRITTPKEGTFDVNAVRGTKADITDSELVITDNIAICENNVDKSIPKANWDGSKEGTTYYLGTCANTGVPLPKSPTTVCQNPLAPECIASKLPDDPSALVNQYVPVNGLEYCADGGVKSDNPTTGTTIKRATIVNASTEGGTIDLVGMPTKVKYGEKAPAVGTMDISVAQMMSNNKAVGATLTGVTLDDVYIDTNVDYIDASGNVVSNGTYIKVTGGTTKPTTTKEDGTIANGTIISGMITAGKDAAGNPVRGSITSGIYADDISNADTVITKGRRTRGKITNATIENATTTTVAGKTVVDAGTITSGQVATGSTSPASTFGTVTNATLTGATISKSNHCFSSGTVGSRGQLNWKEVVK